MSKVLVLVGHPNLAQSRHNAALLESIRDLEHVTVHDLYAAYPDFKIDAAAEQQLLAEHDVIVFQHPVYWYNTTPLFRQWQDDVLTFGWAFNHDGSPSQTSGKKGLVASTAGGTSEGYSPSGRNGRAVDDFLNNWAATMRLCQFDIQPSFELLGTGYDISDEDLAITAKRYRELLESYA